MIAIKDYFVNLCICVTMIFIGSQFLENIPNDKKHCRQLKFVMGAMLGILGVILIEFSITVIPGVLVDLRNLPIIIAAIFMGPFTTFITGIIIMLGRLFIFDVSSSSITGAEMILLATATSIIIGKFSMTRTAKLILMFIFTTATYMISLIILIDDRERLKNGIILVWVGYLLGNIMIYYLCTYLEKSIINTNRLKSESNTDFLTGLSNTRRFDNILNNAVKEIENTGETLSLLMMDIDHFKKINDNYGHAFGDVVLKELGEIFIDICKDKDTVARVGGEEFCIILKGYTENDTLIFAEKINEKVKEVKFSFNDSKEVYITISIGAAIYPDTVSKLEEIKERADNKLYEAKQNGRDRVCI